MTAGQILRVRYRNGVVEHYGPMADRTAIAKGKAVNRLAQDPHSDFAGATVVPHMGGARDLGHLIASDAFGVFGPDWQAQVKA